MRRFATRTLLALTAATIATFAMPVGGQGAFAPVASGRVIDVVSGSPVAGATVVVSSSLSGGKIPASVSTRAVTQSDGRFAVRDVPPDSLNVAVYAKQGYPALHEAVRIGDGATNDLAVVKPSAAEVTWLARINDERGRYGLHPVIFDQAAMVSARYWAQYMSAHQYFDHTLPGANPDASAPGDATPVTRYAKFSGLDLASTNGLSENIAQFDASATWHDAEDAFMAEGAQCPHGRPEGCKFTEATGHFLNILNPDYKWVGLGMSRSNKQTYYDQEFVVGA